MAAFPLRVRGLNVALLVFSLLVLGGSAYVMSLNKPMSFNSSAAYVYTPITGELAKKGMRDFSPCSKVNTTYAIIGQPFSKQTGLQMTGSSNSCIPITVITSLIPTAESLLGTKVVANGNLDTTTGSYIVTSFTAAVPKGSPSRK